MSAFRSRCWLTLLFCETIVLALTMHPTAAWARSKALKLTLGNVPLEAINLSVTEAQLYQDLLGKVLHQQDRIDVISPQKISVLLAQEEPSCLAEITCLRRLGQRAKVDKLLSLRVGRLAETVVLRITAYDVRQGIRQGTWQEVLQHPTPQTIEMALHRLTQNFLPPLPTPPPSPAWYSRWWVWTVVGVVVAGSVTAAVLSTREDKPEIIISLPE